LIRFFPPHFFEATMLKEGERDHRHERMVLVIATTSGKQEANCILRAIDRRQNNTMP
jgi:hypothetical protein